MVRRLLVSVLLAALAAVAVPLGAAQASDVVTGPTALDFGTVKRSHTVYRDVTLTVTGAEPVTFGEPSAEEVPGASAEMYYYVSGEQPDTCIGQTVAAGGSCSFVLGAAPNALGAQQIDFVLGDDAGGTTRIRLSVTGVTDAAGSYFRVAPTRVYDTRSMGTRAPIGPGKTLPIQVAGRGGVPSQNVSAVVVNLTAIGSTASSYLTAFPSGTARPNASAMTFPKGFTGANMVTVPLSADGKLSIFNNAGNTHVALDVAGYYVDGDAALGSQANLYEPRRWYDSRQDGDGGFYDGGWVRRGITYDDRDENLKIYGVLLNVTAVSPTGNGYLSVLTANQNSAPKTSTVNYTRGQTTSNMVIAVPGRYGDDAVATFTVQNTQKSGSVHIIIDVIGLYKTGEDEGLRFMPAPITRVLDTRNGVGLTGPFAADNRRSVHVDRSLAPDETMGFVSNLTGVAATQPTFLTAWSGLEALPGVSNLNLTTNQTRANAAYLSLRNGNLFDLYNKAGKVNVVTDVTGRLDLDGVYFDNPGVAKRIADGFGYAPSSVGRARTGSLPAPATRGGVDQAKRVH